MVDRGAFEAPVGADLETRQFAARRVLLDGQGLHTEVIGELLNREHALFSFQQDFSHDYMPLCLVEFCD